MLKLMAQRPSRVRALFAFTVLFLTVGLGGDFLCLLPHLEDPMHHHEASGGAGWYSEHSSKDSDCDIYGQLNALFLGPDFPQCEVRSTPISGITTVSSQFLTVIQENPEYQYHSPPPALGKPFHSRISSLRI